MPANSKEEAYQMLVGAFQGMLATSPNDNDRFTLYYDDKDSNPIDNCELANNYYYRNFLTELQQHGEQDLLLFLHEIEDKSPAIDYLYNENEELFNELSTCSFYLPSRGLDGGMDSLGITWLLNASLLSLPTDPIWRNNEVLIEKLDRNFTKEALSIPNVSKKYHGLELRSALLKSIEEPLNVLCPSCNFSDQFVEWIDSLDNTNRIKVREKLRYAEHRNFSGGLPLFKTLKEADGIRELRMPAFPGGSIRILFGALENHRQALLVGFIKKSDTEGYDKCIPIAKNLWNSLKSAI